jgi:ornithine cyclodeaminase/alanine dehydrogenase-like protein (mu-crystallin family)
MRELERDDLPSPLSATTLVVVGRGPMGRALAEVAEEHRPTYHPAAAISLTDALAERAEAVARESGEWVSA